MDTIEHLIRRATISLDELGFAEGTKRRYKSCWNCFEKFAVEKNIQDFTPELGQLFLTNHYRVDFDSIITSYQRFAIRSIKILINLSQGEPIGKCFQRKGLQTPTCFVKLLDDYTQSLIQSGLSFRTIECKRITLIHFLHFLKKHTITYISRLQAQHVITYINSLKNYATSTKETILYTLRDFFHFLTKHNHNSHHLTRLFMTIRSNKLEKLPSYYTLSEIQRLLSQVNRDSEIGRRDYLVLLLAIELGLRTGDIKSLKLNEIKWHLNKIELIQHKTKNILQLPLSNHLKYALLDYLKNSRPKCEDNHIFIRHRAPHVSLSTNSFWWIFNKYAALANIDIKDRKRGLHAMRHSLASNLLKESTPLPVISGILGHENTKTTTLYLRIDVEQLRTVALEVPL